MPIQKTRFVGLDLDTELRFLEPTSYRDALNCRVGVTEKGGLGSVENVQGNLLRGNPLLPAGSNLCIGTLGDDKAELLIIWYWNSIGNHSIQTYDIITKEFALIVQWSGLNFDAGFFITGAEVVEDEVYWTDAFNPQRKINLNRPYPVNAPPLDESELNLYKRPPSDRIYGVASRQNGTGVSNLISDKNLQFTHRYVYIDNEKSAFASYSKMSLGENYPNIADTTKNYVQLTVPFDIELTSQIKRIEVAVRAGNNANLQIFHKIEEIDGSAEYTVDYYGNENHATVADSEANKVVDAIPLYSNGLAMVKNRLFLTSDSEGLDAVDDIDINIDLVIPLSGGGLTFKSFGTYNLGLVYYDENNNRTGVLGSKSFTMPVRLANNFIIDQAFTVEPSVTIAAGSIPDWATTCQLVRTEEQYYEVYAQYPVNVWFYQGSYGTEAIDTNLGNYIFDNRRYNFWKGVTDPAGFQKVHLQMPQSVPFVPDTDTYVRILTRNSEGDQMSEVVERVQEVLGDMLVVGDFGIGQDWNDPNAYDTNVLVEVFKVKEGKNNIFYEIGEKKLILNPGTPTRSIEDGGAFGIIEGDSVLLHNSTTSPVGINGRNGFRPLDSISNGKIRYQQPNAVDSAFAFEGSNILNTGYRVNTSVDSVTESPTNIKIFGIGNTESNLSVDAMYLNAVPATPPNYIPDYSKADSHIGFANAEFDENITLNRNGTIRYSDPYVQDSNINGLSSFFSGNQYSLPYERDKITRLLRVGRVLLAIHEDTTTALYIGEGFMKQNDEFVLVKTDNVIGDDRIMSGEGEFGCVNPESVVEYEGEAFWWDMINGVVVRYTKAGLFPISSYGMGRFFQEKAKRMLTFLRVITKSEASRFKVVGGYDPEYDEYLLSFPAFDGNPAETWAFNADGNRWMSKMSFSPQNYGKVTNTLFSFAPDGNMYEHNANTLYNNFYGIQYNRSITFVVNQSPEKVKKFTNIHINVEKMSDGETTGDYKVIEATTPEGQATYIPGYEFIKKENLYRSTIFRDTNSNNIPVNTIALRNGQEMRSQVLEVKLNSDIKTDVNRLIETNVVYVESDYSK